MPPINVTKPAPKFYTIRGTPPNNERLTFGLPDGGGTVRLIALLGFLEYQYILEKGTRNFFPVPLVMFN